MVSAVPEEAPESPLISFAVPTAGSPKLGALLQDFQLQYERGLPVEILVVINGPAPSSLDVQGFSSELPLRVVRSEPAGLTQARLTAARQGRGRWLWFLDDDVRIPGAFLRRAVELLENAPADFGGGPLYLPPSRALPAWITPILQGDLALHRQERVRSTTIPIGANYFLRRSDLLELEAEILSAPYRLDRAGASLLSCGEIDISRRLEERGRLRAFFTDLWVYHDVHAERLDPAWFERRAVAESVSLACMMRNYGLGSFLVHCLRTMPGMVWHGLRLLQPTDRFEQKILRRREAFARIGFLRHFGRLLRAASLPGGDL